MKSSTVSCNAVRRISAICLGRRNTSRRKALMTEVRKSMPSEPGWGWTHVWQSLLLSVLLLAFAVLIDLSTPEGSGAGYFSFALFVFAIGMFLLHRYSLSIYLREHSGLRALPAHEQVILCGLAVAVVFAPREGELTIGLYLLPVLAVLEWRLMRSSHEFRRKQFFKAARACIRRRRELLLTMPPDE